MRPQKIIMSAFGPYAGRVEVDLDKLGENGIYLITGDTGAGKTTIFDAITYALYGEASGSNREANMFRSKYADLNTPTEVELYFSYGNKNYYIKRNPEYERAKSHGEGTTTEKANAELHYPDNRVITKVRDVNNAVVEIMGITREQFTQIAMIAQGDFLKILLASTEERKKIFQKLFKTENYNYLQNRLKSEAGKVEQEYKDLNKSIEQYKSGISVGNTTEELALRAEKVKNGGVLNDEALEVLDLLIKSDTELNTKNNKELEEIEKEIERINKELTEAETLKTAKISLKNSQDKLSKLKGSINGLKEKLSAEEIKKPEIQKYIKETAEIEAQIEDYSSLDRKKASLKELKVRIERNIESFNKQKEEKEKKEEKLKAFEAESATFSDVNADKVALDAENKILNGKMKESDELLDSFKELDDLKNELENLQKKYIDAFNSYKEKKDIYDNRNRDYLNEQAGILAENLESGKPCPVCGATEHPMPATKSPHAPTEAELKKAKKDSEKAGETANTASQNAGNVQTKIDEKKKSLCSAVKKLLDRDLDIDDAKIEVSAEKVRISQEIMSVSNKLTEIKKKINRKEFLEKNIPTIKKELNELIENINSLDKSIGEDNATEKALSAEIKSLSEKLKYQGADEANAAAKKLKTQRQELEKAYEAAKKAVDDCENAIKIESGKIKINEELLKNAKDIDIDEEKEKKNKLSLEKQSINSSQKEIYSRIRTNTDIKEKISSKIAELNNVGQKLTWLESLSNTANGNITGKEKVMLETYIQAAYFEKIINRANQKLLAMTNGQYELTRKKSADNNRSQSGLDLNVIDHYNGSERSVKTLSGGESFKASLSLALGLSEEIQSSSGGIKLDTIFVDEGFGSLDEESLSQAMNALNVLADGKRLIGIISHVSELKNRIEKQIVVTKEKSGGSKIEIIV